MRLVFWLLGYCCSRSRGSPSFSLQLSARERRGGGRQSAQKQPSPARPPARPRLPSPARLPAPTALPAGGERACPAAARCANDRPASPASTQGSFPAPGALPFGICLPGRRRGSSCGETALLPRGASGWSCAGLSAPAGPSSPWCALLARTRGRNAPTAAAAAGFQPPMHAAGARRTLAPRPPFRH